MEKQEMYTIALPNNTFIEIKKSKFICDIYPIKSIDDINEKLKLIRKINPNATHYCYAYIFNNNGSEIIKFSDDGEPNKTAGIIILDVLKKKNLTNVLAIVTRYFGGIKLGANGLVRAYSLATANTIDDNNIIKIEKYLSVCIITTYQYNDILLFNLQNYELLSKEYSDVVKLTYKIKQEDVEIIKNKIIEITKQSAKISIMDIS